MSKPVIYQHYLRALARWPRDALRPDCQFQDTVQRRIDKTFLQSRSKDESSAIQKMNYEPISMKAELEQVNALYLLLENRFSKTYPIQGTLMKPISAPSYYSDLITELETAPNRSFLDRVKKRIRGMLRFS